MKIGLFSDTYFPIINGISVSVKNLYEALKQRGHDVVIFTNDHDNALQEIDVVRFKLFKPPKKSLKEFRIGFITEKMKEVVNKENLDIIHIHTEFTMGRLGRKMAKKYDIPMVYTYHTMYEDYTHYVSKRFGNLMKKTMIKMGLKYANASSCLICPTSKVYKKFDEYGYQKEKVIIPSGIDFEAFKLENLDNDILSKIKKTYEKPFPHFIFVGRISHEKNIYSLLKNIHQLNQVSPVYLTIIGDGPDKEEYMDYVKSHGLIDQVTFTGMIKNTEIPYFYRLADAFISFSKTETQGLTYIEALASNTPVFAHEDHHLHEIIKDGVNGYLFKDDHAFIPLITPFIQNKQKLLIMQENGAKSVLSMDKNEYGKNIEALYLKYVRA